MTTSKQRLERLKELLYVMNNHDKLFKATKTKFDLNTWADAKRDLTDAEIAKAEKEGNYAECSSAGCALGSAGLHKKFISQGLKTVITRSGGSTVQYAGAMDCDDEFEAGARFFGISNGESNWLFNPNSYRKPNIHANISNTWVRKNVTPDVVAKRVKKLIKHYEQTKNELIPYSDDEYLPYDYLRYGLAA